MRLAAPADGLPGPDAHGRKRSGASWKGVNAMAKGNILIADDDAAIRTVLNRLSEKDMAQVVTLLHLKLLAF